MRFSPHVSARAPVLLATDDSMQMSQPSEGQMRRLTIDQGFAGHRIDRALAEMLPEFSRSRLQQWIEAGRVLLNGSPCRPRDKVWGGDDVTLTPILEPLGECTPQAIPVDCVFEDEHLIVVNKPAGLVVHPAAGHPDGTLQNALLYRFPELDCLPRAGLVHRLDRDTTGLMVVARTLAAHKSLVDQLQRRDVHREYRALVSGDLVAGGRIEAPIGRHPVHRIRMAVVEGGRASVTHYQVLERFAGLTLLAVKLETGRTHQIRVHMAHLHHPLVGDPLYGGRLRLPKGAALRVSEAIKGFLRQALHATALGLSHPATGEAMRWQVPLPGDLSGLLELLRQEHRSDEYH